MAATAQKMRATGLWLFTTAALPEGAAEVDAADAEARVEEARAEVGVLALGVPVGVEGVPLGVAAEPDEDAWRRVAVEVTPVEPVGVAAVALPPERAKGPIKLSSVPCVISSA